MALVIAVPGSEALAARLAAKVGLPVICPEFRQFPDGEIYLRITESLTGEDVVLVGCLHRPAEKFLLVAMLAATARDLGAHRVGLVVPYLAFMRQDARFKPGEAVTATYFGKLMSATVDWLVTVDPHLHRLDSLDHVYSIPTTIARAAPAIAAWIKAEVSHPVLVGPDAESVQWVAAVAEACGAPFVILEKTRRGDRDVSVSPADGRRWNGETPVVIDDIVSTGRTMVEATRQLCAAGSMAPMCIGIHAVFADAVEGDLVSAGARGLVTCNTIVHASNRIDVDDSIAAATRRYL